MAPDQPNGGGSPQDSPATGQGSGGVATSDRPANGDGKGDDGGGSSDDPRVSEARREAIAERQKRQELEATVGDLNKRIQEFEDRDKSDSEKNQERLAALERERDDAHRELAETRLSIEVQGEAAKAGARYPDAIVRFVNPADVKRDRDGKATNLEEIVSDVRDRYPDLFRARAGRGDAGGGSREGDRGGSDDGSDMSARIRRASGRG